MKIRSVDKDSFFGCSFRAKRRHPKATWLLEYHLNSQYLFVRELVFRPDYGRKISHALTFPTILVTAR